MDEVAADAEEEAHPPAEEAHPSDPASGLEQEDGLEEVLARVAHEQVLRRLGPYFEHVDSKIVMRRLVFAVVPLHTTTADLIASPDFYGPTMLALTEAMLLASRGYSVLGALLWPFAYWLGFSGLLLVAVSKLVKHAGGSVGGGPGGRSQYNHVAMADPGELENRGGLEIGRGGGLEDGRGGGGEDGNRDRDRDRVRPAETAETAAMSANGRRKVRRVYLKPLRLDQTTTCVGYGLLGHVLALLLPTLLAWLLLLSSGACVALVVYRSLTVFASVPVAAVAGISVIALHSLIVPALFLPL